MERAHGRVELSLGDITQQHVDAIVNAANAELIPGGGVDGAINRAGGPAIGEAMRAIGGCATGDAVATTAGDLDARYVIHAVGPIWRGGGEREDQVLASCYRRSLALAAEHGLRSIAFPAISTGVYGFPPDQAARIAVRTVTETPTNVQRICLVAFDAATHDLLQDALPR